MKFAVEHKVPSLCLRRRRSRFSSCRNSPSSRTFLKNTYPMFVLFTRRARWDMGNGVIVSCNIAKGLQRMPSRMVLGNPIFVAFCLFLFVYISFLIAIQERSYDLQKKKVEEKGQRLDILLTSCWYICNEDVAGFVVRIASRIYIRDGCCCKLNQSKLRRIDSVQ